MTFHAGNGITLTQEEENLPPEEREKLIRQKQEWQRKEQMLDDDIKKMVDKGDEAGLAKENERLEKKIGQMLDDDIKKMVDKGDEAGLAKENERLEKKIGKPVDYGIGDVDGSKVQDAVDLVNKLADDDIDNAVALLNGEDEKPAATQQPAQQATPPPAQQPVRQAAVTPAADYTQKPVYYTSGKNEDFTERRKEREAQRQAREAARKAEAARREELLATGRYFDDGRGNVKLRTRYRKYYTNGSGPRPRQYQHTMADDGAGMASIRKAGEDAYAAAIAALRGDGEDKALDYTKSAVQANREAAAERQRVAEESRLNTAKAKLSVFDGFAAALDALESNAEGAQDNVVSVWGGKDEQGRDARWKYDEQGRVIGQADARQVVRGKRLAEGGVQQTDGNFRKGFVDPAVLKVINSQLQKRGADYAITGIMARQAYGALGKPVKGSSPVFYVQGLRNDGTQFGQYLSLKDVYRWGVDNYRLANANDGKADGAAENFAITALRGYDPDGYKNSLNYRQNDMKLKSAESALETQELQRLINRGQYDMKLKSAESALETQELQRLINRGQYDMKLKSAESALETQELQRLINRGQYDMKRDEYEMKKAAAGAYRRTLEDNVKILKEINSMLVTKDGSLNPSLDEEKRKELTAARDLIVQSIVSPYARRPEPRPEQSRNVPVVKDGVLVLPNGKVLRKDQEYVNPGDGKRYIWRGGDPRNFELIK